MTDSNAVCTAEDDGKAGGEEVTLSNSGPHTGSVSFNILAKWMAIGVK